VGLEKGFERGGKDLLFQTQGSSGNVGRDVEERFGLFDIVIINIFIN
jgi:hypothetical protein